RAPIGTCSNNTAAAEGCHDTHLESTLRFPRSVRFIGLLACGTDGHPRYRIRAISLCGDDFPARPNLPDSIAAGELSWARPEACHGGLAPTSPDGTAQAKRSVSVGLTRRANSGGATGQPPSARKPRVHGPRNKRRHARHVSTQRVARDGLTPPARNPTRRHHQPRHSRPQSEWSL